MLSRRLRALTLIAALGAIFPRDIGAYATTGAIWQVQPVPYSINTTNLDLPESAVEPAVRVGADVWAAQSSASIGLTYMGRSAQTSTANDGVNLVVFRNASSGSAIATTYWWSSGGRIIDADIVFWDAAFRFFSGSNGCSGGFYIEDIAAHEFGHALGLGHSDISGATMFPSVSSCNAGNRTLDADDIAGVRFLYPPVSSLPSRVRNLRIIGS
jgi:matrixin